MSATNNSTPNVVAVVPLPRHLASMLRKLTAEADTLRRRSVLLQQHLDELERTHRDTPASSPPAPQPTHQHTDTRHCCSVHGGRNCKRIRRERQDRSPSPDSSRFNRR